MRLRDTLAAAALLAAAVFFMAGCAAEEDTHARLDRAATDFTLKDTSGRDVSLSDFKGKVIVLDFWATWCNPCRKAVPELIEIHEKYRDRGAMVMAVTVNDSVENTKSFIEEFGITYPVVMDENERVMKQFRVSQVPTTFVIGRDGKVKNKYFGFAPGIKESFFADIEAQLSERGE